MNNNHNNCVCMAKWDLFNVVLCHLCQGMETATVLVSSQIMQVGILVHWRIITFFINLELFH